MPEKINWEEWKKRKPEMMKRYFASEPRRAARNRPRDPEREKILTELIAERRKKWLESGKLVKLGPRHWRLTVTFDKPKNK